MTKTRIPSATWRWPQMIAGFNILLLVVGFFGILFSSIVLEVEVWILVASLCAGDLVYSILGVLILSRHPRHRVGYWFMVIGFFYALAILDGFMYALAITLPIQSEALRGLIVLVMEMGILGTLTLPVSIVLLYFPDGRLPSRRWWPVAAAALIGAFGILVRTMVLPFSPELQAELNAGNPLVISGLAAVFEPLGGIISGLYSIGSFGALGSLVVRYRRAGGNERARMKWLVYTAVISMFFLVLSGPILQESELLQVILFWPILLAAVIGISILRHRLWDIDIIIRRTFSYALLSAVLGLVYYGTVLMLQGIFQSLSGDPDSALVTVISTLAIAALFNPLRTRIQDFIDRRFYREKYNAEQVLARFSAAARDDVDLESLAAAVLGAVGETMKPESVYLWIKPAKNLSSVKDQTANKTT